MALIIFVALILLLVFGPGIWVRHVLEKYSKPADRYPGTGADLARLLIERHGLSGVRVEETEAGDHYDPEEKVVRLTPDKYRGRSLTAITVAAHEVGHALQDASGYWPFRLHHSLARVARVTTGVGTALLLAVPASDAA